MNSLEALLSEGRQARSLRGQIRAIKRMRCSAQGIVIQKQTRRFGTMRPGTVAANHKMSPWAILIRSENFGKGDRM
jgi:hypothetical protein